MVPLRSPRCLATPAGIQLPTAPEYINAMSLFAIILFVGTMLISLWAAARVKSVYRRYSQVPASSRATGASSPASVLLSCSPRRARASATGREFTSLPVEREGSARLRYALICPSRNLRMSLCLTRHFCGRRNREARREGHQ